MSFVLGRCRPESHDDQTLSIGSQSPHHDSLNRHLLLLINPQIPDRNGRVWTRKSALDGFHRTR
jgi:hypothetical protein